MESYELRHDKDRVVRLHYWEDDDGERVEIVEAFCERPDYNPNDDMALEADRFWDENAKVIVRCVNSFQPLLAACNAACDEFERLTGDEGFDPSRFRERIAILQQLSSVIKQATDKETT